MLSKRRFDRHGRHTTRRHSARPRLCRDAATHFKSGDQCTLKGKIEKDPLYYLLVDNDSRQFPLIAFRVIWGLLQPTVTPRWLDRLAEKQACPEIRFSRRTNAAHFFLGFMRLGQRGGALWLPRDRIKLFVCRQFVVCKTAIAA
jgi:hypothetical protein